jgi:hypothetical protein
MYRRPKFLEVLHAIREQMARECDYDMDLFVQRLRQESPSFNESNHSVWIPGAKPKPTESVIPRPKKSVTSSFRNRRRRE